MAKKQNDKNEVTQKKKTKGNKCKVFLILLSLLVAILAVVSYKIYSAITHVPELPELDLDVWWGPDDMKNNQDTSIRKFRVLFSDSMQEEIRKKFDYYRRRKPAETFNDTASTYGLNSKLLEQVYDHWQFKYKFKERETFLNQYNHFKTNVQGLDIHFVHVIPKLNRDLKIEVLPLLLLHGWPSSFREFYEAIPLLTTVRPGHDFVFELIIPSLPGFGFSQGTTKRGLSPYQIAITMRNLMQRLGFKQYYIQGGDYGKTIGSHISTIFPKEVLGFHGNMPLNLSKYGTLHWILEAIWPGLLGNSVSQYDNKLQYYIEETGYMHLQGTKPDTAGIALQDSALGLAAYIIDRILNFSDPENKLVTDMNLIKISVDDLLDNVLMYWVPGSVTTSLRMYKEAFQHIEVEEILESIPTPVPTWVLGFKNELFSQPECVVRRKFPNLRGITTLDFTGHYAAFEHPKHFANNVFLAVNTFKLNK